MLNIVKTLTVAAVLATTINPAEAAKRGFPLYVSGCYYISNNMARCKDTRNGGSPIDCKKKYTGGKGTGYYRAYFRC